MRTAAIVAAAAFISGNAMANPDWSKVAPVKMNLIHQGQASLEWVMDSSEHSAVNDCNTTTQRRSNPMKLKTSLKGVVNP